MRNINTLTRSHIAALALVLLMVLNILAAALPMGGFKNADASVSDAASVTYPRIAVLEVPSGNTAHLELTVTGTPVIPDYPESEKTYNELSFWVKTNGIFFDNTYDPYVNFSYADGRVTCNVYAELDSTIELYADPAIEITGFKVVNDAQTPDDIRALTLLGISKLATVDVTDSAALESLTLYNLPALKEVRASDCALESISVDSPSTLTLLDCSGNSLTYGDLIPAASQPATYDYASQSDVSLPAYVRAGGYIDLSHCTPVGAVPTEYKWYFADGTEVADGISPTGVVGIYTVDASLAGQTVYCVMTNQDFPALTELKTTEAHIVADMQFLISPVSDTDISFAVSGSDAVKIYADGTEIPNPFAVGTDGTHSASLAGPYDNIYVVSASPVIELYVSGSDIENIDVSACAALEKLEVYDHSAFSRLSRLDLSSNKDLESLTVNSAALHTADLSVNTALKYVDLSDNLLTDITLPAEVTYLDISGNSGMDTLEDTAICADSLETLKASSCSVEKADLSIYTALSYIDLSHNKLSEITLGSNPYKHVDISHNKLPLSGLPVYPTTLTNCEYIYNDQAQITINTRYNVGDVIDLTGYKSAAENDSYKFVLWCDTSHMITTDGTIEIPAAYAGKEVYASVYSSVFEDNPYESNKAQVNENYLYKTSVLLENADSFTFTADAEGPIYVNWGDGNLIKYEAENGNYAVPFDVTGNAIRSGNDYEIDIYCAGTIHKLDFSHSENESSVLALNTMSATDLEALDLSGNKLTEVDLSKNTALKTLDLSDNALTKLDISALKVLTTLDCSENSFTFASLPEFSGTYNYLSQSDITISETIKTEKTFNELSATDATTYKWYNAATDKEVTPKTSRNGVFTFGDELKDVTVYCKMTSTKFPNLTLTSTKTKIISSTVSFGAPDAILYTTLGSGKKVSITVSCDDTVYFDWGNGSIVSDKTGATELYTSEKDLKGTAIKIYTNGKLTLLSATDMQITSVSLVSATDLEVLNLSGNTLTTIDLSKNTKLKELDISNNRFVLTTLPPTTVAEDYTYSPQADVAIPTVKAAGAVVDLSAHSTCSGTVSKLLWFKKNSTASLSDDTQLSLNTDCSLAGSGKYVFSESLVGESVYCVITNTQFPDFASNNGLKTTAMLITAGGELTLNDTTGLVYDINIDDNTTCTASDGTIIAAGDLKKSTTTSSNTLLTFSSKKFTDTSTLTTTTILGKVKALLPTFDASDNHHYIYDFTLLDSKKNEVRDLNGKVNVTLRYPNTTVASKYSEYDFYMYHYITSGTNAGSLERLTVTAASDGLTFTATSFSPYILIYQANPDKDSEKNDTPTSSNPSTTNPDTGDHSEGKTRAASILLWISLIVMAAVAASAIAVKKNRKTYRR